jgi:hypothetical protein
LIFLDNFTRANILGELTFDQVETISTSPPVSKLVITHGPDGSIDHDSAVNTVCLFLYTINFFLLIILGSKYFQSNLF